MRFPRPEQAVSRVASAVLVVLAWGAVAHQSGSGWVQALGALVAAGLAIGYSVPAFAARKLEVRCTAAPLDAEAGQPLQVVVACGRPARIDPVAPGGTRLQVPASGEATLELSPQRRGVLHELTVDVATAFPFGMLWWRRRIEVRLPHPVHVAPRLGEPLAESALGGEESPAGARHTVADTGDLRSVRGYIAGDSPRRVHWPATAHAGRLMVRDMEQARGASVVVGADLPADEAAAETRAERVLGNVDALLRRGVPVVLVTDEVERPPPDGSAAVARTVRRQVVDRRDAGRRLARAVAVERPSGPGRPAL